MSIRADFAIALGAAATLILVGVACSHASPTATPTAEVSSIRCVMVRGVLPDPLCTPGATNPAVTQDNIASTICKRGWTATVRPPQSYTNALKKSGMAAYGFTDAVSAHEEDHLIPLELGGSPRSPLNLWPEPGASPNAKDHIENVMNGYVCTGNMTLDEAQKKIAADWTTADP